MAPQFVKPYIKSQKNDAEGICEAVGRPNMRFVAVKTTGQQDIQAIHRIRSGLIQQRTAKANQARGLLAEYGIVIAKRIDQLRRALPRDLRRHGQWSVGNFPAFARRPEAGPIQARQAH